MAKVSYETIVDVVVKGEMLSYYKERYDMLIGGEERNYNIWVDYLSDKFNQYKGTGFTEFESKVNALSDSMDEMIDKFNQISKENYDDEEREW